MKLRATVGRSRMERGAFRCPDCGKSFTLHTSLMQHQRIHCKSSRSAKASRVAPTIVRPTHECTVCRETFGSASGLRRHMRSHSEEERYMCCQCGLTFTSNVSLVRHQKTHNAERPFTCTQCHKSYKNEAVLLRHQRVHSEEHPYQCDVCTKGFSQKSSLIAHLKTHSREHPYSCSVCDRRFCSKSDLTSHQKSHQEDEPDEGSDSTNEEDDEDFLKLKIMDISTDDVSSSSDDDDDDDDDDEEETGTEEKEDQGRMQKVKEEKDTGITRIIAEKSPPAQSLVKLEDVPEAPQDSAPKTPLPDNAGGGVICPDCGKTFKASLQLIKHQRMHSTGRPFPCTECGKSFSYRSTLARHQRNRCHNLAVKKPPSVSQALTDTSELGQKCGICTQRFQHRSELKKHLAGHIDGRYTCKDCGRDFNCNYFLVRHQRTHTGEQPFKCKLCLRGFTQRASLVIHIRTHTGERPYICFVCGKAFHSRSTLIRHQRSRHDIMKNWKGEKKEKAAGREGVQKSAADPTRPDSSQDKTPAVNPHGEGPVRDKRSDAAPQDEGKDMNGEAQCSLALAHRSLLVSHRDLLCNAKLREISKNYALDSRPVYKCGICQQNCRDPGEMKRHLKSHGGEQRYMCSQCNRSFTSNFYLVRHQRTHTGERPFTCTQCQKSFKCSSVLLRHQRIHSADQPYRCEVCTKGFSQKTSLIIHLRTHTGERPFSCWMCGRSFCSRSALLRHEQIHMQDGQELEKISTRTNQWEKEKHCVKQEPAEQERDVRRPETDEAPGTQEERKEQRGDKNPGEVRKDAAGKEKVQREGCSNSICPDCGKFFHSETILREHQKLHSTSLCCVCPDCGKSFSHRSSLMRHQNSACIQTPGIVYPDPVSSVSAGQQFHKCGICHLNFSSSKDLRKHLRSHKGNGTFMCRECGQMFNCNFSLVRHQRTHSGERPFTCLQCNKSFKCSSVLLRHQRIHTGEQPYQCDVCLRCFSQKPTLINHLRTHTGERPFSCQVCGRSFCSRSARMRHEQGHQQDSLNKEPAAPGEVVGGDEGLLPQL